MVSHLSSEDTGGPCFAGLLTGPVSYLLCVMPAECCLARARAGEGRAGKCPALGRVLGGQQRTGCPHRAAVCHNDTAPGPAPLRDWTPTAGLGGWHPPQCTEGKGEAQSSQLTAECQPWDLNPELLRSEASDFFLKGPERKYFGLWGHWVWMATTLLSQSH